MFVSSYLSSVRSRYSPSGYFAQTQNIRFYLGQESEVLHQCRAIGENVALFIYLVTVEG
jgi:hypothetical protein